MAVGEGCLAFGELFGKPGAARAAASAAVRARKVGEDTFHLFIGIGLAEFRNEQDTDGEQYRDGGKDAEDDADLSPLHFG